MSSSSASHNPSPNRKRSNLVDLADCLISSEQLEEAIELLADSVSNTYQNEPVVLWCVLRGGIVVTGKILPHITSALVLDYVHATRYQQNQGQNKVEWLAKPSQDVEGKHILICDDIFDEGLTLQAVSDYAHTLSPLSVKSLVLCDKAHTRKPDDFKPDFVGLTVPDRYVFGAGMDYDGWWRNAPGIWALKEGS